MHYRFNCRVCKEIREHRIVKISDDLPPNTHAVECLGCGSLSIRLIHIPSTSLSTSVQSGSLRDGAIDWDGIER